MFSGESKVNGKSVSDANVKVIYAKVTGGVATIENYEVSSVWKNEGTAIEGYTPDSHNGTN